MEPTIEQIHKTGVDLEETIRNVIAEKLGIEPDQFYSDTDFYKDLGIDSLDMMEIFMELEKKFDITIPDEDAEKLGTLRSIIGFIQKNKN